MYFCVCWSYMLLVFCLLINNTYICILPQCQDTQIAVDDLHKENDHMERSYFINDQLISIVEMVANDDTDGKVTIILFTLAFTKYFATLWLYLKLICVYVCVCNDCDLL